MTIDMSQFYQVFFDEADELLAEFDAIPPAQRGMSVSSAMARMMAKRFPCKA